ncbi:amino-acid N-acetyltransferase [Zavarzinella formosa]|uniref:amino-acid N-acetyltransferase n=1 Tax=Zavarzinella formosa TaxID=360055 RepID=UPI0003766BEE|nr:amino-acid N-acetyltransferase [Zavarzinella formosa]
MSIPRAAGPESRYMLRLTDLREILRYIPQFRDRVFVIAIDGAIVSDDNFTNLMLDIKLLRSLRIGVAIVHGAGLQIRQAAAKEGLRLSNSDGIGVTDPATLRLSIQASQSVTHQVLQGLADNDLRAAATNSIVAHPAGILGGIDHQWTGRLERIDTAVLKTLLDGDIIPVIAPLGFDGEGRTFRLNSDAVAVEVAKAVQAVKLIYLSAHKPPRLNGRTLRTLTTDETVAILKKHRTELQPVEAISKLENATKASKSSIPRVHIIDGTTPEGLLAEVFSNDGVGTLVHANEYQSFRKAQKKDLRAIHALIQQGVEADELLKRTRADVERQIDDFFVFEVDKNPVACGALHQFVEQKKAELACVYVDNRNENRGIGVRIIRYAEELARTLGHEVLFCLSTQAINYFVQKGGFQLGTPDDLPPARRLIYDRSGRHSQVLIKRL